MGMVEDSENGRETAQEPTIAATEPKMTSEDCVESIRQGSAVSLIKAKKTTSKGKSKRAAATEPMDALSSLPLKRQLFVKAYTDRSNPKTFGNGTQSAISAGYGVSNYEVAKVSASEILASGNVRTAISEMMEKRGLGKEVRTDMLADLAKQRTSEILHYDGDGNLVQRQVVDNSGNRIKALTLASKLAGDFDSAREAAHAQAQVLQPLIHLWSTRLRESLKAPPNATVGPTSEAESESGIRVQDESAEPTGAGAQSSEGDVTLVGEEGTGDGGEGVRGGVI